VYAVPEKEELDHVDVLLSAWQKQNPELDIPAKAVTIRLRRVTHYLEREVRRELAEHGIDFWEFEMMLALRRSPGHQLHAGALQRYSQVTSGAITNRIARLEDQGWVRRDIEPKDRRQVIVSLTESGEARAQAIFDTKIEAEHRLLGDVDPAVLDRMTDDLRTLLIAIEGPADSDLEVEPGTPAHRPICDPPPRKTR
jgi:DNA-binding MarR family transcriptional regulator